MTVGTLRLARLSRALAVACVLTLAHPRWAVAQNVALERAATANQEQSQAQTAPASDGTSEAVVAAARQLKAFIDQVADRGRPTSADLQTWMQLNSQLSAAQSSLPPDRPRPTACRDQLVGAWLAAQQGRSAAAHAQAQTAMDCYAAPGSQPAAPSPQQPISPAQTDPSSTTGINLAPAAPVDAGPSVPGGACLIADGVLVIERGMYSTAAVVPLEAPNPGECVRYTGRMADDFQPSDDFGSFVSGYVRYGQVFSLDLAAGQCISLGVWSGSIRPGLNLSGPGLGTQVEYLGGQGVGDSFFKSDMIKTSDSTLIASTTVQLSAWETGPTTEYFALWADPIDRELRNNLGVKGAWDRGIGAFQLDLRSC